jgi:hypothetical protein
MAFNHLQYNAQYLQNAQNNGAPINDAAQKYGVQIVEAAVNEGETYWKVIGVHHLLPLENFSKHNVYIEALDEQGRRLRNPIGWAGWTWKGRRDNERADPIALDKPDSEAAGNIAMHFGQIVSTWMKGPGRDAADKSDRAENLHTAHPDEPTADGKLLNTLGHHSFYVVFQRTRRQAGFADGLIRGRLERGQGQTVRLKKGNADVAQQIIGANLTFEFTKLSAGAYRVEVAGTTIAQDNITIDAANKTADITLAMPAPANSVISGQVVNGAGKAAMLVRDGAVILRFTIPVTERFRITDLTAGVYSMQLTDTTIRQDNIVLDGSNTRDVILTVPDIPVTVPTGEKIIAHYLLFGPPGARGRQTGLLLAANFMLAFSVTAGFSLVEAKQARQVTIIGDGVDPAAQQTLQAAGCRVELLTGHPYDIEAELNARIQAGRAFGV